jgi:gamma-glutamyl-gamma-aminobutyrate hydrolase PuuD
VGKAVIGITTYLTPAAWGAWQLESALVPADYVRAIVGAGGTPVLIPPGADTVSTVDIVDGLVFSGGSDLDPDLYGQAPHPETNGIVRERDDFELALMRTALERDVPMLAICRGSQVLNVALGGTLEQHVPDRVHSDVHKQTPGVFAEHDVEVVPGSRLAPLLGDRHRVKSHHHQGFAELGPGLREAARAPDGTVEALEDTARRFAIGVLWHPEAGEDAVLFEALVREATAYSATRPRRD